LDGVRASDAEREATIERLRVAAGEGRLTFEELADRIDAAGGSSTRGELERLTGDLPAGAEPGVGSGQEIVVPTNAVLRLR
jgi:hypothetical protein